MYDFEGNLTREPDTVSGTIREFGYDHNNQECGDLNLYRYAGNDPHNCTDPSGETAAVEYQTPVSRIAARTIEQAARVGECVCGLLGTATLGLYGMLVDVSTSRAITSAIPRPGNPKTGSSGSAGRGLNKANQGALKVIKDCNK